MKNRIETGHPSERYYAKKWLVLADGGSDQWMWAAKSGNTYVFIEIIDLVAYTGRDAQDQWSASVASVDLDNLDPDTLYSVLRSFGSDDDPPDMSTEQGRLAMAEMCFSYGAKAPLWDDCAGAPRPKHDASSEHSRAFRSLLFAARKEAENMLRDETREHALDTRIVNAIGQTARQYASGTGGLWDRLREVKDAGENATPEQQLVLKMFGKCEHTLGAGPIPADLRRVSR